MEHEYRHLTNCSLNNVTYDMAFKNKQDSSDENTNFENFAHKFIL